MCLDFIFYYGAAMEYNHVDVDLLRDASYTILEFAGAVRGAVLDPSAFNFERNASFDDAVEISEPFGTAPKACSFAEGANSTKKNEDASGCFPGFAVSQTRAPRLVQIAQLFFND